MDAPDPPVEVVRRFCGLWAAGDLDAIVGSFTDDAVYHNMPIDPVVGPEAIRTFIDGFLAGVDTVTFEVRNIAADGEVVLTDLVVPAATSTGSEVSAEGGTAALRRLAIVV